MSSASLWHGGHAAVQTEVVRGVRMSLSAVCEDQYDPALVRH